MIAFCDIGNTSYHFLKDCVEYKKNVNTFDVQSVNGKVFYICVNVEVGKKLKNLPNWIDMESYIDRSSFYKTMGIDRVVACMGVENSVIVDAGSAITVDIVKNSKFKGGFIYPGLDVMQKAYKNISSMLDYEFNFECDFNILPKNTRDSITYGCLKTLQNEVLSYGMEIILTGGDADKLKKIFVDAKVDKTLVFKGMQKIYDSI